jgi:hypothetical protein
VSLLNRLRRTGGVASILDSTLLVLTPVSENASVGSYVLEADREISVVSVTDDEGLAVLPAFTSEAALMRWKPEGSRYLGLQGRVVIELLANGDWNRMVVDTDSPDVFAVTREEAVELLRS